MANYKPALFNSDMVQALLEGRKTETRRVIKPQPAAKLYWTLNESCWPGYFSNSEEQRVYKPPFRPGDIIWVRETYRVDYLSNIIGTGRIQYKADGQYADICFDSARYDIFRRAQRKHGWQSCECMPREAARLFLRVVDVHVDRLQDINGLDAYNEGAIAPVPAGCLPPKKPAEYDSWSKEKQEAWIQSMARAVYMSKLHFSDLLIKEFRTIWDKTIRPEDKKAFSWAANPYVWVICFEKVDKPSNWID